MRFEAHRSVSGECIWEIPVKKFFTLQQKSVIIIIEVKWVFDTGCVAQYYENTCERSLFFLDGGQSCLEN